jgi:hypothetical protein
MQIRVRRVQLVRAVQRLQHQQHALATQIHLYFIIFTTKKKKKKKKTRSVGQLHHIFCAVRLVGWLSSGSDSSDDPMHPPLILLQSQHLKGSQMDPDVRVRQTLQRLEELDGQVERSGTLQRRKMK